MNRSEKWDFLLNNRAFDVENKRMNQTQIIETMMNKTLGMFHYEGLPDSLPVEEIEKRLQMEGKAFIYPYNDELRVFSITLLFDDVDIYGQPLKGNIFFQDTKKNITVSLDDGILIRNDYLYIGLLPILEKYSRYINESELTLYIANIWKRASKLISGGDDATIQSARDFISKMENGTIGVIAKNPIMDSLSVNTEMVSGVSLNELIQYDNYLKSLLYNELGLSYNKQMKKERLITSEVEQDQESNRPLIDNMLSCREKGVNQVNEKFGEKISVVLTSAWGKEEPVQEDNEEEEY